ncbi:MAG: hypothetical protein ACK5MU_04045 [Candidatus Saccharimonadales bacterium]
MADSKENKKWGDGKDDALTWVQDKYEESWLYASQRYHTTWDENWKLYNGIRTMRRHAGVIKTFVPMTRSAIITIVAALYSSSPKFVFVPDDPQQDGDTEILSEMMDDFYLRDGWAEKNLENGKNMEIVGNGVFYYEYSDGIVSKTVIPIRDTIIDPRATSWRNWRYAGRRYHATKTELKSAQIVNPETGELERRYKNLDKLTGSSGEDDMYRSDKTVKDMNLGQSTGGATSSKNHVEIIEIWTKKRVATVANRATVIEDIENPYLTQAKLRYEKERSDYEVALAQYQRAMLDMPSAEALALIPEEEWPQMPVAPEEPTSEEPLEGIIPFALGRSEIDTSLVYGGSSVDVIKDQQELLNDFTEISLEAELYTLYPERSIDPEYATRIDNLDPAPGKTWPVPPNAMQWNNPPAISGLPFQERANIKQEIREALSTDGVVKGISSTTKQTATEVNAQMAQASQIIQLKARTIADDLFFQEGKIVFEIMRLYADDIVKIRTINGDNIEWKDLQMSRFMGNYTPKVELKITRESTKELERESARRDYQILIQDPTNNLEEIKRIYLPKMLVDTSEEEIERMITPPAQGQELGVGALAIPQEGMNELAPEQSEQIMSGSDPAQDQGALV